MTDSKKSRQRAEETEKLRRRTTPAVFRAYLQGAFGADPSRKMMRCPDPQSHTNGDKTPSAQINDTSVYCHACARTFHILDLICIANSLTPRDKAAWDIWRGLVGYNGNSAPAIQQAELPAIPPPKPKKLPADDLTPYFAECNARAAGCEYFKKRGITQETVNRLCLGYDPRFRHIGRDGRQWHPELRVIFPTSRRTFKARRTTSRPDASGKDRFKTLTEPNDAPSVLYCAVPALTRPECPVFITEGEFDAVSVIQAGGNALALSGKNVKPLLLLMSQYCQERTAPVVIMLDGDKAGQDAARELIAGISQLREIGQVSASFSVRNYSRYPDGCKDANDILVKYPGMLEQLVQSVWKPIDVIIDRCKRAKIPIHISDDRRDAI